MPTTRSQSKKLNPSQSSSSLLAATPRPDLAPQFVEISTPGALLEWLDLDFSETSSLKHTEWKAYLKEIQYLGNCRDITFACPMEEPQRLWIIIRKMQIQIKFPLN